MIEIGKTPWRDQKDEYHKDMTNPMVGYFLTHHPGEWMYQEATRKEYDRIWPGKLPKLDQNGTIAESTQYPEDVWGTLVTEEHERQGKTALSQALKLKEEGKLWGYDPVLGPEPDHTGKSLIHTPFGDDWIDPGERISGSVLYTQLLKDIRLIVREEVTKVL